MAQLIEGRRLQGGRPGRIRPQHLRDLVGRVVVVVSPDDRLSLDLRQSTNGVYKTGGGARFGRVQFLGDAHVDLSAFLPRATGAIGVAFPLHGALRRVPRLR